MEEDMEVKMNANASHFKLQDQAYGASQSCNSKCRAFVRLV